MTLRHTLQPLIWSKVLLPLEKRCISVVVSNINFWGFIHLKHWNVYMKIFKFWFLILRNLKRFPHKFTNVTNFIPLHTTAIILKGRIETIWILRLKPCYLWIFQICHLWSSWICFLLFMVWLWYTLSVKGVL